jgi:hypothetical protein
MISFTISQLSAAVANARPQRYEHIPGEYDVEFYFNDVKVVVVVVKKASRSTTVFWQVQCASGENFIEFDRIQYSANSKFVASALAVC